MDRQLFVLREHGWFRWRGKLPSNIETGKEALDWLYKHINDSDAVFAAFSYEKPKGKVSQVSYTLPDGEKVEIKEPDLPTFLTDNVIEKWVEYKVDGVKDIKIERSEQ